MKHRKLLFSLIAASSFSLFMGIALPSCPGQEMISKVDSIDAAQKKLVIESQGLNQKMKTVEGDLAQAKELMGQMTTTLQEHKTLVESLQAKITELEAKLASGPKRPATPPLKKKGR